MDSSMFRDLGKGLFALTVLAMIGLLSLIIGGMATIWWIINHVTITVK